MTNFEEMYFSIVSLKASNGENRPYIIISAEDKVNKFIDSNGIISETKHLDVFVLDVYETIVSNSPIIESYTVSDKFKFCQNGKLEDGKKYFAELVQASSVIAESLSETLRVTESYTKALSAIRFVLNKENPIDKGKIIINGQNGNFAELVFNTVKGNPPDLTPKEINAIGESIVKSLMDNLYIDLDNPEELNSLKSSIEFTIIESSPDDIKLKSIEIDPEKLKNEIKKLKSLIDNDDNDNSDNNIGIN